MTLPGFPEGVVVSAGIVTYDHDQSGPDELLSRAERALAKASAAGGKIIVSGRSPSGLES
jgi:GGDEF domain-containing protein